MPGCFCCPSPENLPQERASMTLLPIEGLTLGKGTDAIKQLFNVLGPLCSRGQIQDMCFGTGLPVFNSIVGINNGMQHKGTQCLIQDKNDCSHNIQTSLQRGLATMEKTVIFQGENRHIANERSNWLANHEGKVQSWWTYVSLPLKWKIMVFYLNFISKWVYSPLNHCFGGRLYLLLKTLVKPPYGNSLPKRAVVTWHVN